jgi:4-diphosphocytidyl-2-C-methyl-D-erythritol kinase
MAAAAQVGSDVSFFIRGGTAVMAGRGEIIRPAVLPWRGWIVLLMPGFAVSTALVYRACRPGTPPPVPEPDDSALDAVKWMRMAYNMLEEPAMVVCPTLRDIVRRATELVGRPVRISGSGSTLYTAFDAVAEARAAAEMLSRELQLRTDVVQPVEGT